MKRVIAASCIATAFAFALSSGQEAWSKHHNNWGFRHDNGNHYGWYKNRGNGCFNGYNWRNNNCGNGYGNRGYRNGYGSRGLNRLSRLFW